MLQVIRVPDFDAAIAEANDTRYGLSASLVGQDPAALRPVLGQYPRRHRQLEPPDQRRVLRRAVRRRRLVGQPPPQRLLRGGLLRLSGGLGRGRAGARRDRRRVCGTIRRRRTLLRNSFSTANPSIHRLRPCAADAPSAPHGNPARSARARARHPRRRRPGRSRPADRARGGGAARAPMSSSMTG